MEIHPDREISTELLASLSRYLPRRALKTDTGLERVAQALVNVTRQVPSNLPQKGLGFMFAKGQAGISREMELLFNETSQNPVLLDAVGLSLAYYNIPSLPQLPPSSRLLKTLWPRMKQYAVASQSDPLCALCDAGAAGNETAAKACMATFVARIPQMQADLDEVRKTLWHALPNLDDNGVPFSGSYWNEADYNDYEFQRSHWGDSVYKKLLEVKTAYDPSGLFVCHHCVGSEFWTPDGNCRLDVGTIAI